MATVKEIKEAFTLVFESSLNPKFKKTKNYKLWKENGGMLSHLRFFLLGYFGKVQPEANTFLNSSGSTDRGRVDFAIHKVAIEFAVRNQNQAISSICSKNNWTEVHKLLRRRKSKSFDFTLGVLVLFDYSLNPDPSKIKENYRNWKDECKDVPLHGNCALHSFNVLYFYIDQNSPKCLQMNIRG
ncbi:MAG: hypothetical protein A2508_06555 [Candidatus Lambdaproteobacteria bacterium RIFOXYD12_FULL_49_8]|nr:MAG: hypothetical protein A2508_06555 [Candidatus Lambdaproteobacteria bacterium RIFOXYD12_FULL_49_8]